MVGYQQQIYNAFTVKVVITLINKSLINSNKPNGLIPLTIKIPWSKYRIFVEFGDVKFKKSKLSLHFKNIKLMTIGVCKDKTVIAIPETYRFRNNCSASVFNFFSPLIDLNIAFR